MVVVQSRCSKIQHTWHNLFSNIILCQHEGKVLLTFKFFNELSLNNFTIKFWGNHYIMIPCEYLIWMVFWVHVSQFSSNWWMLMQGEAGWHNGCLGTWKPYWKSYLELAQNSELAQQLLQTLDFIPPHDNSDVGSCYRLLENTFQNGHC